MIFIGYKTGCRNCFQSDGVARITPVMDGEVEYYTSKTEFELMNIIERWRDEENETCDFCNSSNVEVMEITVNDNPLYDFEKLKQKCDSKSHSMIMFNLQKDLSGISLRQGGNQTVDNRFLHSVLLKTIDMLERRPENNFDPSPKGFTFICLTGGLREIEIERFKTIGVTRDEIYTTLKPLADKVGLKLPRTENQETQIQNRPFKGSFFNKWFYLDSLEEAKATGYPYSNAYFDIDDHTIIAIGTSPMSPREFIDSNQNNYFVIDPDISPLLRNEKTIHYAKMSDKES